MKKAVAIFLILMMVCCSFSACTEQSGETIKVQQITYSRGAGTENLTSEYFLECTTAERVDEAEYLNATNKMDYGKTSYLNSSRTIDVDGMVKDPFSENNKDRIDPKELNNYVGKTYYYERYYDEFYKVTITSLHLSYVNVKFLNDGTFEVSYYDKPVSYYDESLEGEKTMRVKADNYEIVYFSQQ